jgi:hypothetical protein
MIEVERDEKPVKGRWYWRVRDGWGARGRAKICGYSRQPLLDACRALKRMGVEPSEGIRVFRKGRSDFDLQTTVGFGSSQTVLETSKVGPRFVKFRPFEGIDDGAMESI